MGLVMQVVAISLYGLPSLFITLYQLIVNYLK